MEKITDKDWIEFNAWIKSKDIVPTLRKKFKSGAEYEQFMIDQLYQESGKSFSGKELGINQAILVRCDLDRIEDSFYYSIIDELSPLWNKLDKLNKGAKLKLDHCVLQKLSDAQPIPDVYKEYSKLTNGRMFSEREKVSKEDLEKAKTDGVVQKKPNGAWGDYIN